MTRIVALVALLLVCSGANAQGGRAAGSEFINDWQGHKKSEQGINVTDLDIMGSMSYMAYVVGVTDAIALLDVAGVLTIGKAASNAPTLEEFLEAARPVNPGISDQELIKYYNDKYGFRSNVPTTQRLKGICEPNGVSRVQRLEVVSKWLEDNPDKWNVAAFYLVYQALEEAWPCPE